MTLFGYTIEFHGRQPSADRAERNAPQLLTLGKIRPGEQARIKGFATGLSPERLAHLQSYGLVAGRLVRVLQHAPVTVILVDNCELALEADLARLIEVDPA